MRLISYTDSIYAKNNAGIGRSSVTTSARGPVPSPKNEMENRSADFGGRVLPVPLLMKEEGLYGKMHVAVRDVQVLPVNTPDYHCRRYFSASPETK